MRSFLRKTGKICLLIGTARKKQDLISCYKQRMWEALSRVPLRQEVLAQPVDSWPLISSLPSQRFRIGRFKDPY